MTPSEKGKSVITNPSKAPAIAGVLLAAGLVLVGCGGRTKVVDAPPPPESVQTEYRIGPGDSLQVFVWNHPELTVTVPVRPDGLISTPLVENMEAGGKTPSQLSRDLEKALAEYVRTPTVNVIVTNFVGALADQVRVVGQAQKPQALPYRANMTVLDVMIAVGGLSEFAAGNRAVIVRQEGDKNLRIPVRLSDLMNDGDIAANVALRPGDVLIIPESRF
jgi:polysaccharide export outer membrane protein